MKKQIALVLALLFLLAGCGTEAAPKSPYLTVTAKEGNIQIEKSLLSTDVLYVNYDCDGTMMQLLAGIASDGSCRAALNTCQSCSPSPKAYFVQTQGKLICQNCGNAFTMDNVGQKAYGCNPTYIESTQTENAIVISEEAMKQYAPMFAHWGGPTEPAA